MRSIKAPKCSEMLSVVKTSWNEVSGCLKGEQIVYWKSECAQDGEEVIGEGASRQECSDGKEDTA